jgi:hypothetical protein
VNERLSFSSSLIHPRQRAGAHAWLQLTLEPTWPHLASLAFLFFLISDSDCPECYTLVPRRWAWSDARRYFFAHSPSPSWRPELIASLSRHWHLSVASSSSSFSYPFVTGKELDREASQIYWIASSRLDNATCLRESNQAADARKVLALIYYLATRVDEGRHARHTQKMRAVHDKRGSPSYRLADVYIFTSFPCWTNRCFCSSPVGSMAH